jgi:hypothetical protein
VLLLMLLAALPEVMDLIAALPKDIIALSTMTEGTDDPDMHEYADKMDLALIYFGNYPS